MTGIEARAIQDRVIRSTLLLVSAILGAAVAFIAFVLFLQSAAVSTARLLAALVVFLLLSLVHYGLAARWSAARLGPRGTIQLIGLAILLVALFFPLLYRPPAYPLSPLLRPWSDLAVQFEVPSGSPPLALAPGDVKLVMGREALNTAAFELVGPWQSSGSQLRLAPGDTASLRWTGTLPETTILSIQPPSTQANLTVYWDNIRTAARLNAGEQAPILINHKASLPWGFNLAFLLSCFILAAWALSWISLLAGEGFVLRLVETIKIPAWVLVLISVTLALLTVRLQLASLDGGLQYLTTTQFARHSAVLQGQAPDPWQYRLLSEYIAEGLIRLAQALKITDAVSVAFILLRLLQNVGIFLAAFAVYKSLAHADAFGLMGVLILAGSMLNAFYDNDLSFNTYFDLLFYLLCILFLLRRNYRAVVILMVFAALNRETSGLIPFVMAGAMYGDHTRSGWRKYVPVFLSLVVFIGIFAGLRWLFPARPLYIPYRHAPGIPLLLYNLTRSFTWQQLLATLGLVPLVGLAFFSTWPLTWQRLLLIVCPAWFVIHSFASVMAETRLFLVPQAIIFIPGALFAVCAWLSTSRTTAISSLSLERGEP